MGTCTYPKFALPRPRICRPEAQRRPLLIIVGAGPVGLAAIDARSSAGGAGGSTTTTSVSIGSRAVCYAKRALEVLDRLCRRSSKVSTRA